MASPLLQQLLASVFEHDFAQSALASLEHAAFVELDEQAFAGVSLVVLTDVVLVLSAEVTL